MIGLYKHKLTGEIYEIKFVKKELSLCFVSGEINKSKEHFPLPIGWNRFNYFQKIE
jgi:hypothetical protein